MPPARLLRAIALVVALLAAFGCASPATNLGPGQAMLVERTLRFSSDTFDDTEVYKGADGAPESTTYHFTRSPQGQP